jgi:endonuclease-8
LDGQVVDGAEARGKHLFVNVGAEVLHVHLGLIGTFHVKQRAGALEVGTPARLRLETDETFAELRGPMICALIDHDRQSEIEAKLGADPLDATADPERGWQRVTKSRRPIAELLMDQAVLAGVGNVYRCEILHRHRVDPFTPGTELGRPLWHRLWDDLVLLMPLGMAFSQIITMSDQVAAAAAMVDDGSARRVTVQLTGERLGDFFERRFHVYKRTGQPCDRCGRVVRERLLAGRTLYWCPGCQTRRKR